MAENISGDCYKNFSPLRILSVVDIPLMHVYLTVQRRPLVPIRIGLKAYGARYV